MQQTEKDILGPCKFCGVGSSAHDFNNCTEEGRANTRKHSAHSRILFATDTLQEKCGIFAPDCVTSADEVPSEFGKRYVLQTVREFDGHGNMESSIPLIFGTPEILPTVEQVFRAYSIELEQRAGQHASVWGGAQWRIPMQP